MTMNIKETMKYVADLAKKFDPDQPRDDHGRFASSGGGGGNDSYKSPHLQKGEAETVHGGYSIIHSAEAKPDDPGIVMAYVKPTKDEGGSKTQEFASANTFGTINDAKRWIDKEGEPTREKELRSAQHARRINELPSLSPAGKPI